MANSPESNSLESNVTESDSNVSLNSKVIEVHPLAFTIEFNDQKVDEARKSKVQERLSAFSLKHRRNPSLPDFGVVKNAKSSPPMEKLPSPLNSQHVPVLNKGLQKSVKASEIQWKSSAFKAASNSDLKSPVVVRKNLEVNGVRENFLKHFKHGRRSSLSDIDSSKLTCQNLMPNKVEYKMVKNGTPEKGDDLENKSDTVSEAGTYTVDKDDESPEKEGDKTQIFRDPEENENNSNNTNSSFSRSWINDWVRDVEKQNSLNYSSKEGQPTNLRNSGSRNSSPGTSKIPSPINTLSRKAKLRNVKSGEEKPFPNKVNGSVLHRRSSSLSNKDYDVNHGSESSLETESFLRATESVVTAMQNRMRLSLDGRASNLRKPDKRDFNYKERPHPPSTASDTDTNSETESKTFKKPILNPFNSARLNRAFSLRRAKAEPDEFTKKKGAPNNNKEPVTTRSTPSPKTVTSKPPSSNPFSRIDCGRFSMRGTVSNIRSNLMNQSNQKKDVKKPNQGNRSSSSLSSREVEFQNWRRRKSFDPMKAAAEGRKKELAKKAAMNQSMTQSVNLGNGTRSRSSGGNPVLRSASFHSTAQVFGNGDDEREEFGDQGSTDEQEESAGSSWASNHHSLPHNSPTHGCTKCGTILTKTPVFSSRCSLISETHSSPSRRMRSDDLDNLVMTAISEVSQKLKIKSCNLLKKLNCMYDPCDEKFFKLKDEIAVLESRRNSAKNSPIHQAASRDLSTILKNLKELENVLRVLDDVLFEENLEIYVNE